MLFAAAALIMTLGGLPARSVSADQGTLKDSLETIACNAPVQSIAGHGFNYCGDHWPIRALPIRFRLNVAGMPSYLASPVSGLPSQFELAARAAAQTWDQAAIVSGGGTRQGCLGTVRIMCVFSVGTTGEVADDNISTIRWDALPADIGAYARVWFRSGAGQRIKDVDIVLNSTRTWYWGGSELVSGLALGLAAAVCEFCPDRMDLQSILTHEMGHAMGLLHVNPGSGATWPSDAEDAPDYNQVMYPRYYKNNATQRALNWGDMAGLQLALVTSQNDPT